MIISRHFYFFIFSIITLVATDLSALTQFQKSFSAPFVGIEWTQSFYTDDSSAYLTLFPDGFKQLIRIDQKVCDQIRNISVLFKDPKQQNFSRTQFRKVPATEALNSSSAYFSRPRSDLCWFQVETRGIHLNSKSSIQYVLKIQSTTSSKILFFKGITDSLIPSLRLTENDQIDSWIDLGNFGATPVVGGGVLYKIWEPLSERVDLFINQRSSLVMNSQYSINDDRRFHFLYVEDSKTNDKYHFQFMKNGQYENLEIANFKTMSPIKIDPMARELTYDARGGRFNGYINPRGIVSTDNDANEYIWKNDTAFQSMRDIDYNNWIIYQLWPLAFNPQQNNGVKVHGTFKDISAKIPYLNQLGVNAVEFLPVNVSRFNASWGYALDSLIIIDDSLGSKADFKKIIDELHGQQIRVLFDVVINHVNNSLLRDPLTSTNSLSKFYSGNTAWGPRPKFESVWVRKWILDSLMHVRREFHIDGFRFDMTDSIFNGSAAGTQFLQELNYLLKLEDPGFYNTAEQLPDNVWVTYPQELQGLGFDAQWNDRFKNFFELEFDQYRKKSPVVDLKFLAQSLLGYSDQDNYSGGFYHFGDPQRTVNYLGSHDFVGNKNPFIRIITGYDAVERQDQNIISRVNPLEESSGPEAPFRKIHNTFSHAAARLAYGILFTKPGASLFYQGEELAQDLNLENEWSYMAATNGNRFPSQDVDIDKYVRSHQMPWAYWDLAQGNKPVGLDFTTEQDADLFKGQFHFFKKMIAFKKSHPEINSSDVVHVKYDNQFKILVYEIKTNQKWFFIVLNFGNKMGGAPILFPGTSDIWWNEVINSSTPEFAGENGVYRNVMSNLGGRTNLIRLEAPAFYLFEATDRITLNEKLFFRSTLNNWSATQNSLLKNNPLNSEELMTFVSVPQDQIIEFKIGNKNWDIDIGKNVTFAGIAFDDKILSYLPYSPNVTTELKKGLYQFYFNLRTFKYRFEQK